MGTLTVKTINRRFRQRDMIYYKNGKEYDVIDICKDYNLNFNRGNIVKYVIRAGKKDDELKDLLKAQDYLQREIDFLRKSEDN
jgi:hypothetical protein